MRAKTALFAGLVALVVVPLASCDPAGGETVTEREYKQTVLAHSLQTTALAAGALGLLESGDTDRAQQILSENLEWSITEAEKLTSEGVRLGGAAPNLVDGLRRASRYLEAKNPSLAERAARTAALLDDAEH